MHDTDEEELKPPAPEAESLTLDQIKAEQEAMIDYKDKYLRVLADSENTKRRLQKEKQDMMRFAIDHVLTDILVPIDQLENALGFASQMQGEVKNWAIGFEMILNQFKEVLTSHGITAFTSEGELFNPLKHEAVESEETDTAPEGTILKEFLKGYKSGDRIIRVARVKVAKKKKTEEENNHDN
ncbi:nucleotide exchange factor GrpE [Rhabdochlamydiaceae symbiont of Dictyostelium giganteum]|uniref:nucleotide exchange factor GrpE n=1 Tax=Rhabdochlamydiaceae symbiont of Dictyostelium giganteum TaxID=3342349 RepID=UPI00384A9F04